MFANFEFSKTLRRSVMLQSRVKRTSARYAVGRVWVRCPINLAECAGMGNTIRCTITALWGAAHQIWFTCICRTALQPVGDVLLERHSSTNKYGKEFLANGKAKRLRLAKTVWKAVLRTHANHVCAWATSQWCGKGVPEDVPHCLVFG